MLLILGCGYFGQTVAWYAARLVFAITVGDDCVEFSVALRIPPAAGALCGTYTEIVD